MQPQPSRRRGLRRAIRIILPLASIALLAGLLWFSDLPALAGALSKAALPLLLAGALIELATLALRVLRWKLFINTFAPASLGQAAASYFPALFLSNFTPGRVGEPVRALFLKQQMTQRPLSSDAGGGLRPGLSRNASGHAGPDAKFSAVTALPAIIVERAFDVLALVLLSLFAITAIASPDLLLMNLALLVLIVLAALVVFKKPALLGRLLRLLRLGKGDVAASLEAGARLPARVLAATFLLSLLVWALEGLVFWLAFASIGVPVGPAAVSLFAFSVLIGLVTLLPGGIGSTELSLSALVAKAAGAPLAAATAGALLGRLATFWLAMFVSGLWWRKLGAGRK